MNDNLKKFEQLTLVNSGPYNSEAAWERAKTQLRRMEYEAQIEYRISQNNRVWLLEQEIEQLKNQLASLRENK